MNKIVYVDLDGVIANLLKATYNLIKDKQHFIDNYDPQLDLIDANPEWEKFVWTEIEKAGYEFWENLEKYDYADKLIFELEKLGQVIFLTSVGNSDKYPVRCANAAKGKILWIKKYFPNRKTIITKEKFLCASENRILIDDLTKNTEEFIKYGGKAFLWNSNVNFDEQINKIKEII